MKKGYYLYFTSFKVGIGSNGVYQKIKMQMCQFANEFDISPIEIKEIPVSFLGIIKRRLPFVSVKREYKKKLEKIKNPDFIYIRFVPADREYIKFLKRIKTLFPKCKIIIELFTYPYEKDLFDKPRKKIYLWKDRYYRKEYYKYVDRLVAYTQIDKKIFGIPVIQTMNGVDVEKISIVNNINSNNNINLIFVGYMQKQHGLERIIEGLYRYYKNSPIIKVFIYCVGNGLENEKYIKLVKKLHLTKYVIFYGKKTGQELDAIYDESCIGISALGAYKNNIEISSALKSREYLAKGIPVIAGGKTDVFEKCPCEYHLDFPNDDSPINIMKVVDYYQNLLNKYGNKRNLAINIRKYAMDNIDNRIVMKPIIDYIKEI